tara:strand:+ start:974 stop:1180 length:207 start_codon:yes stop_codon:yes gene_type:complete
MYLSHNFKISDCSYLRNLPLIPIGKSEIINNNNETTIIDGPEEVLNSKEQNNPKITDNIPANIDIKII